MNLFAGQILSAGESRLLLQDNNNWVKNIHVTKNKRKTDNRQWKWNMATKRRNKSWLFYNNNSSLSLSSPWEFLVCDRCKSIKFFIFIE